MNFSERLKLLGMWLLIGVWYVVSFGAFIVGGAWTFFYNVEVIPDNAKIVILPASKKWAPAIPAIEENFKIYQSDADIRKNVDGKIGEMKQAEYRSVKKGGEYSDYTTDPRLLDKPYNIKYGYQGELPRWWFNPPLRWNADGTWNY